MSEKLRQVLLRENPLSLDRAIHICRSFDASQVQSRQMQVIREKVVRKVSGRDRSPVQRYASSRKKQADSDVVGQVECKFCGFRHKKGKSFCPAYGKICRKCRGRNHFQSTCSSTVHEVQEKVDSASSSADEYLHAVEQQEDVKRLTAMLQVNDCNVRFQLDTGADVNTIC